MLTRPKHEPQLDLYIYIYIIIYIYIYNYIYIYIYIHTVEYSHSSGFTETVVHLSDLTLFSNNIIRGYYAEVTQVGLTI